MKIGYDAKRLFFNGSGLGNYSRSTVSMVARFEPEVELALFSPKPGNTQGFALPERASVHLPSGLYKGPLRSLWRSSLLGTQIRRAGVELYHGLSHELPGDIGRSGAKSLVTMHDLIFVRHPELYRPLDRMLYVKKYRRSCALADRIIAISGQTRDDLVSFWQIDPARIDVVYQGCDPMFYDPVSAKDQAIVRAEYQLPAEPYILSVGTVEARKNLMLTVDAMAQAGIDTPLVVCGRWTPYQDQVAARAKEHGISHLLHFRNAVRFDHLPAIYQMARAVTYTSLFEGFGIPILEALNSGVPVITSRGGVFPETGGDAAQYVDPRSVSEMAAALRLVLEDEAQRRRMIQEGRAHALRFRQEAIFPTLWAAYQKALL